jgi:tetratricopeptide (TPR) repeat protein
MPDHDPTRAPFPSGLPTADPAVTGSIRDPGASTSDNTPATHSSTPPSTTGRYVLSDEIAHGGMGVVFRATDTILRREVAVKVLHEKFGSASGAARRFLDEAQITAQLQHPAIPPIHDLGTLPDGRPFLAMKLIKGETLEARLEDRPDTNQDRGRFIAVFEQICQGLAYAHDRHVIHRDLKPANVMVGAFGEVQVMDWGLAKVLSNKSAGSMADPDETHGGTEILSARDSDGLETQAGSVLGTPAFMPPEQAVGAIGKIDKRSDVFGLGAILAVILTGKPPFAGSADETTRVMAARGKVDECFVRLDNCGADPDLISLCKRCLAPDKENRFDDASAVATQVAEYRAGVEQRLLTVERERAAAEAKAVEQRKRRRVQLVLSAVVFLTLLLGAAGWRRLELERISRTEARNASVYVALQEAGRLRGQAQNAAEGDLTPWAEAVAAANNVKALLEEGVDPALRQQAEALLASVTAEKQGAEAAFEAVKRDRGLLDHLIDVRSSKAEDRDGRAADAAYAKAFHEAGIDIERMAPASAGAQLRTRHPSVAVALANAVDDWAAVCRDKRKNAVRAKLLSEIAQEADPDQWRRELRSAIDQPDKAARVSALRSAAATAQFDKLDAISLDLLGTALNDVGDATAAEKVLREGQRHFPGDVWLNYDLARVLEKLGRTEEAIRYYQAAKAIRPETGHRLAHALESRGQGEEGVRVFQDLVRRRPKDGEHLGCLGQLLIDLGRSAEAKSVLAEAKLVYEEQIRLNPGSATAHNGLGLILYSEGNSNEALAAYRESIRLDPAWSAPHYNIGVELQAEGKHSDALAEFSEAVRLEPDYAQAHVQIGRSYKALGRLSDAIAKFREAVRIKPDLAVAHSNLAWGLEVQGNLDEALAASREAVRINPDYALVYRNIGAILLRKGHYTEALAQFRKCHELGSRGDNWKYPSLEWVQAAERLVEMEILLPTFLKGQYKPTDSERLIALAEVCFTKQFYTAAVGLYGEAFASNPKLRASIQTGMLYRAACAAAMGGSGKTDGERQPDEKAKAKLRRQACTWLQMDCAACRQLLASKNSQARVLAMERLQLLQTDTNLAGIRDSNFLESLPSEEQTLYRQVWGDVADLLKKANDMK